ncbi:MAG: SGNH/GDSL hydrolase family protein [Candidatus Rokuibacteriota bacterium]
MRNTTRSATWSLVLLFVLLVAPRGWAHGGRGIDLTRLVVVGDSLSAGFQNGSLHADHQPNSYASLVARQAGVSLSLPLIAPPGIPNVLILVDPGPPPVVGQAPGVSSGRVDPSIQPMNLAVPGHTVRDALEARPDLDLATDPLGDLVLGFPGLFAGVSRSQVEWTDALAPTTVLAWLGNNDALGAALGGDITTLTPIADFRAAYREVMRRLTATGAAIVVANVPDVTVIPYFTPVEAAAALVGVPLEVLGPALDVGPGDFLLPAAFELIGPILVGAIQGPLPGSVVLDAGEVDTIRAATGAYNRIIAREAWRAGAALVDVHGLLECVRVRGVVVGGQRLTTKYLGGLFSLDGIHPTNTGYAVIANEFIRVLNERFAVRIPPLSLRAVAGEDPLVLPGVGEPAYDHRSSCVGRRAFDRDDDD